MTLRTMSDDTQASILTEASPPLLEVRDLNTTFATDAGTITAVDGVSLNVPRGKTVALLGESGCGKSVTALSIMRLIPQPPGHIERGQILLHDAHASTTATESHVGETPLDLLGLTEQQMRGVRGNRIAIIFQDPMTAMNPVMRVGAQIVEAIELHRPLRGKAAVAEAVALLRDVGIPTPEERFACYPHQLSGGMLQRVMIAMALSCEPSLLIADEPTTALDATIQLQILGLLRSLQAKTAMSILIITHDLGVVAELANYAYVMYAGRIVEHASCSSLLTHPQHPYTQGLSRCMPRLSDRKHRLDIIPGHVPDPGDWPTGCRFHPRCALTAERAGLGDRQTTSTPTSEGSVVLRRCIERYEEEPSGQPPLYEVKPNHFAACWELDT